MNETTDPATETVRGEPEPAPGHQKWWQRPRWRYAGAAFLLGVLESLVAVALGFEAHLGDRDVTYIAGAVLEVSFAAFGFLIGLAVEARRDAQVAAAGERAQLRALARTRARLAQTEKLASLGQLASTVAHEVRNPLAILRSLVQNLEEDVDTLEAKETCGALLEEIDRLAHVTATLVDFARPMELRRGPVRAAEVAARTRLLADRLFEQRSVQLELVPPEVPDLSFDGDPDLVCQVLLGLLENAAEASPREGTVRLVWDAASSWPERAGRDVGGVEFRVCDQGGGVPAGLHRQIFEPFFTTRNAGHGLGLAVARQIVEAHGGAISVDDAQRTGACFRVFLPGWASPEATR